MLSSTRTKVVYSLLFFVIGFLVSYFLFSPSDETSGSGSDRIAIGFVGPLTGENANIGIPIMRGVELAINELNENGGIDGKQLVGVFEDGKCNAKDATTAVRKLIDQDRVMAIVGGTCSSETLAMAPIVEENKIPLISPSSTNPSITNAGDYVFRVVGSDSLQGKVMAEHVVDQGDRDVAIIYQNSDYNIGLKNVFSETLEELGGVVVRAESYESDAKDYKTQLTKIKAADPDALYIVSYSEGGLIAKQAKELGLTIPLYGPEAFESEDVLADGGNALEGLVFTKPRFDAMNPASAHVLEAYETTYGEKAEFPAYMTNAYDVVMLIAEALETEMSADAIKAYLSTVKDYDGAGGRLTIDANGDALKDFTFVRIEDGEFVGM